MDEHWGVRCRSRIWSARVREILQKSLAIETLTPAAAIPPDRRLIVTYEDHNVRSGLGALLGAHLQENGLRCTFRRLGITRLDGPAAEVYRRPERPRIIGSERRQTVAKPGLTRRDELRRPLQTRL